MGRRGRTEANRHFGAALPLAAGAADDESAGADAEEGEAAGGVSPPPHAVTMAPTAAMAARSATIAIFFMIVFSSEGPSDVTRMLERPRIGRMYKQGRVPLCLSSTRAVNRATF